MKRENLKQLVKILAPPLLILFKYLKLFFLRHDSDSKSVAILKMRGFGDIVLMYPIINLIKHSKKDTKLIAIASPQTELAFKECRDIDEVLVFDPLGKDQGILALLKFLYILRKRNIGIFLDFSHNFQFTPFFSVISGARHRVGLIHKDHFRGSLYTKNIIYNSKEKVIFLFYNIYVSYCSILEIVPSPREVLTKFQIPVSVSEIAEAEQWISVRLSGCDHIIGIHTGSGGTNTWRRWPRERFLALITELLLDPKIGIILTGTGSEKDDVINLISKLKNTRVVPALNLPIKNFFALIGQLDCFLSNDSGPLHIGTFVETYTIGLFGPETPGRYGPIHQNSVSLFKSLPCSPCIQVYRGHNPNCHNPIKMMCLKEISVQEVLHHINKVKPLSMT